MEELLRQQKVELDFFDYVRNNHGVKLCNELADVYFELKLTMLEKTFKVIGDKIEVLEKKADINNVKF